MKLQKMIVKFDWPEADSDFTIGFGFNTIGSYSGLPAAGTRSGQGLSPTRGDYRSRMGQHGHILDIYTIYGLSKL